MIDDFVSSPWLRHLITVAVLTGLVLLGFRVMEPFIVPLVWAAILAYVSWPAYARVLAWTRGRAIVAALIMTAIVTAAVIAPLAWLGVVLRLELVHAYHDIHELLTGGVQLPPAVLKIPWLGDIPIIGGVFRNRQATHTRDEIVFLITPHIVKSAADSTVP